MVTHDSHIATLTDRMLFLRDGRLLKKERKGRHLIEKGLMCPRCGGRTQPDDIRCPHCGKKLKK